MTYDMKKSELDTIHFIITGGTIDSAYNGTKDTVEPTAESFIPTYIESIKLYDQFEFTTVCMKDSRALTEEDRANILKAIKDSPHKKFVVTHGTYTMPDTARYIESNLGQHDKTIIFTGSMTPLMGFSPSDAPFNLGYTLAKIHELGPCITVCMNGRLFEPAEVVKLLSEGKFASIFNN
jgi:L-asparaginase